MPGPFDITSATSTLRLDESRRGVVSFTVSNSSPDLIRGRARLVAEDPVAGGWLSLVGEGERDFSPVQTEQISAEVQVPDGAPAGSYAFRLEMVGVENPDELFSDGPAVVIEVPPAQEKEPFRLPWWTAAVAAAILVVLAIVLAAILWPRKVEVPRIAYLPSEDAVGTLEALDFKVDKETVADERVKAGSAVESAPSHGTRLKRGSQVTLLVSSGPPTVEVPQVVGVLSADAVEALEGARLRADVQKSSHETIAQDHVISVQPRQGSLVEPGSVVTLFVSSGPPSVKVPQVSGKLYTEAVASLEKAGLKAEVQKAPHATIEPDHVISAEPQQESQVEGGSVVTLYVSSGPKDAVILNVVGWPAADARAALLELGFQVNETRAFHDLVELNHVIGVDPIPGTRTAPESAVTLEISDGPAVAQVPDLHGWPLQLARVQLEVLCEPGPCVEVEPEVVSWGGLSPLQVHGSDPPVGTPIARGSHIRLYVEEWNEGGSEAADRCMQWEYVPRRLVTEDGMSDLAEIGEVRSDGREWTLHIVERAGYTWAPAKMVAFVMLDANEIEWMLDLQGDKIDYYQGLEVRAADTISILLKQKNPDFLKQLSQVVLLSDW